MPASINRFWAVKLSIAMTGTSSSWADTSWRATKWANKSRWRVIGKGKPLIGAELPGIPQSFPTPFMLGRTNHHDPFLRYLFGK